MAIPAPFERLSTWGAYALAAIAATSVAQRLYLWDAGTAEYQAAGAPAWVYPGITALQAFACACLLWRPTRAVAAAGIAILPTLLVARRALADDLRPMDSVVLTVAGLAAIVCVATLAARKR